MTTATSRRAILAGAASLATVPTLATTVRMAPDPIFALIEAHKVAFRCRLRTSRSLAECRHDHPGHKGLDKADSEAREIDTAAAIALTANPPTTIAAALALIDYVHNFNQGKIRIDDEWFSAPYNWPSAEEFDFYGVGNIDDADGECGMAYAGLLNVREVLAALAVQS